MMAWAPDAIIFSRVVVSISCILDQSSPHVNPYCPDNMSRAGDRGRDTPPLELCTDDTSKPFGELGFSGKPVKDGKTGSGQIEMSIRQNGTELTGHL